MCACRLVLQSSRQEGKTFVDIRHPKYNNNTRFFLEFFFFKNCCTVIFSIKVYIIYRSAHIFWVVAELILSNFFQIGGTAGVEMKKSSPFYTLKIFLLLLY